VHRRNHPCALPFPHIAGAMFDHASPETVARDAIQSIA
jgi:hypothetical protein